MTTEALTADPGAHDDEPEKKAPLAVVVEWVVVFAAAIAVALIIKTFVMQAFYIPSGSMNPTLLQNDRVLVNKLSYHLHDVNRGDIIVFEKPPESLGPDATKDLIKRVIALPGEQLAFDEKGKVHINGQALDEPYLPAGTVTTQGTLQCTLQQPCKIPPDTVWVMGDNRSNSRDSRFIGAIPQDHIVGRAFSRVWPLNRISGL